MFGRTLSRCSLPTTHVDESSDTHDTIEWLLANVPRNSGRVGRWGISYPGWQTVMGMMNAHPALKAASPQASPADMYIGDDFHHNGAFRLMDYRRTTQRIHRSPGLASHLVVHVLEPAREAAP